LLLSVPHAGLRVPPEAEEFCILTPEGIQKDGDEGAAEIFSPLRPEVLAFQTTDIARAIIDLNRAEGDRRKDGVVKTHTRWDVPVYDPAPPEEMFATLIDKYYRPYHRQLTKLAGDHLLLGVDCHTMAAAGPPVGPDPGVERPWVCLSNGDGTCPRKWMLGLQVCFEKEFGLNVSVNEPFTGGHIIRSHASEMPWVQIEVSRAPFLNDREKRAAVLAALTDWVEDYAE
jgi:N-formylglutamate amidohydrolase